MLSDNNRIQMILRLDGILLPIYQLAVCKNLKTRTGFGTFNNSKNKRVN